MIAKIELDQLLAQPTLTVADTLRIIPISRNKMYDAIARGEIKTVRIGKKILVPTAPLKRQLGLEG